MHLNPTSLPARLRGRNGSPGFTLIELLVVIGIVALLLTVASTAFFGATKQENVTKSRNQLRDVLLMARQQACILGKPHVVVCWNSDTSVTVGNTEQTGLKQGRYALFQYVGQVWADGRNLMAPFGVQREILSGALRRNARLINLDKPDADTFMRVDAIPNDSSMTEEQNNNQNLSSVGTLKYDYAVGGEQETFELPGNENLSGYNDTKNYQFLVARLRKAANATGVFPLGVRVTETFSLPQLYKFNTDRAVFYFSADGRLLTDVSGATSSVSAAHSVSKSKQDLTFSVKVSQDGLVTVGN